MAHGFTGKMLVAMKKHTMRQSLHVTVTLIIAYFFFNTLFGQGIWTQQSNLVGSGRCAAVGFSINGKGYILTGFSSSPTTFYKDFWEFNPITNTWTKKADFGGSERYGAVGFSIGSKGYIGTGWNGNAYTKDFWEYDPLVNKWTEKAEFGGIAREDAVGFSIGSKGYIGTGRNYPTLYRDFWEYDPSTDSWSKKADFVGSARHLAVGFSIPITGKGYIGTGSDGTPRADFWEYNPANNTWTQKAGFGGSPRFGATGFSNDSAGFIGTGSSATADFWRYDPHANNWVQVSEFGGGVRIYAIGFSIGLNGYVGTGQDLNGNKKQDLWRYNSDISGIDQQNNVVNLSVYPNPFNSIATIRLPFKIENSFLTIFNIYGHFIKKTTVEEDLIIIERENLNSGMYFFILSQNEKTISIGKFIISD